MKSCFTAAGRLFLIVALLISTLSGLPFASAEAASYKIHHESVDSNDYYYVYQSSSELDETPTFIKTPWDVYYSKNKENGVRITFFRSFNIHRNAQAEAFYQYLLDHSTASQRYAGYYVASSKQYGYEEKVTIVYLSEGLNSRWDYYFESLWDWNPFVNSNGTTLSLEFGDWGERTDSFSELWKKGCSAILTIYGNTKAENSSFGMIFTEGSDRHVVRRYCVYETWD